MSKSFTESNPDGGQAAEAEFAAASNTSAIKTVILLSLQAQQRCTSKTERKQSQAKDRANYMAGDRVDAMAGLE